MPTIHSYHRAAIVALSCALLLLSAPACDSCRSRASAPAAPDAAPIVVDAPQHARTPIAKAGDPCDPKADRLGSCAADGKASLDCQGGVFVVASICVGPKGCALVHVDGDAAPPAPICDLSVAKAGDPCGTFDHARVTCTADAGTSLRCDPITNVWTFDVGCKKNETCTWDGFEGECRKK